MLEIDALLGRAPTQLSGGQKQRVALGRALVREPAVFLLDEPIAHLDAKLRNRMHAELRRIQKQLGTTTIYATPDYAEAMAMADRLAVVDQGRIVQVGAPLDVYFHPANEFVARFMGDPPMNLFDCEIVAGQGRPALRLAGQVLTLDGADEQALSRSLNGRVRLGVRPADLALVSAGGRRRADAGVGGAGGRTGRAHAGGDAARRRRRLQAQGAGCRRRPPWRPGASQVRRDPALSIRSSHRAGALAVGPDGGAAWTRSSTARGRSCGWRWPRPPRCSAPTARTSTGCWKSSGRPPTRAHGWWCSPNARCRAISSTIWASWSGWPSRCRGRRSADSPRPAPRGRSMP